MKKLILLTSILFQYGIILAQKGDYRAILIKVERQGNTVADSSNIKVDSSNNQVNFHYIFKDNILDVDWYKGETEFYFELKNNTGNTIKVIWDDAAYIENDGTTKKVFHNGVKYNERNSSQPPSTIIKGAKLEDIIAPTDYVYFSSGSYGGWRQVPLFIKPKKKNPPLFDNTAIRISLPLLIDGVSTEYIFTFSIKWIEQVKKKKA